MSSTLFRVNYTNGREYRVFCANNNQTRLFNLSIGRLRVNDPELQVSEIISGIHQQSAFTAITIQDTL